jgi:two-component system, NarL family, captular synthesis response regulator RcsB
MESDTIRIILANDHPLLRKGISQALNKKAQHIQIVAEAGDFQELLFLLNAAEIDILMTDDIMPGGEILGILPIIKAQYPDLKIIVNTMCQSTNPISIEVMALAQGWVSFTATAEEFIKAIETVYAGYTWYDLDK